MAFDPKAFLANSQSPARPGIPPSPAAKPAFDPKAFLAGDGVEARIVELGGVKQADGTYLVPGEGGTKPFRLDAQGNRLDEAPVIGEESTSEAIGNRVLATAASGAQGLLPQIAGAARVAATGDTSQYAKTRDATRATVEQAREKAGIGYDIAGAVLSGGVAAPESVLGRVAVGTGLSAINAAANSEAATPGEFAADVATGAGIGVLSAGLGEGLGAGLRKAGAKAADFAAKAFQKQEAADLRAVEKGIKSLEGELGAETQKGFRYLENKQRGLAGLTDPGEVALAQKVLGNQAAKIPGQEAVILGKEAALSAATATKAADAAKATADYFNKGLWAGEILPRLKGQAPRWGMAAAGMALGEGYDLLVGEGHTGKGAGALFGLGSTLSSPGMRAMLGHVIKSNRVQKAIGDKLAPILFGAASAIQRGTTIAGPELARLVPSESDLGPPELAAQQLVANGGLASLVGNNGRTPPEVDALNAPQSELDRAFQQTTGVMMLAGALEAQNEKLSKGLDRVFKGKPEEVASSELPDLATFKANPQALLETLSRNTGNLPTVAPMIAAELAATAQRATDYMLKVSATPDKKGPLAADWVRSEAEKRSLALASGVIAQPMSILEAAASGMLVPEQVTALNAVYPMLGRQMADMALDKLTSSESVPYRARLMVGFLTGVDPDGTFASIGPNQLAIRQQSQKPSNMPTGGAEKLTLAQRTSGEQVES